MKSFLKFFESAQFLWVLWGLLFLLLGYGSHQLLGEDNPVEEIAEELLKKEYNLDVEFSPHKDWTPNG